MTPTPSIKYLIDYAGIHITGRVCSCCHKQTIYRIVYDDNESFLVCGGCDTAPA